MRGEEFVHFQPPPSKSSPRGEISGTPGHNQDAGSAPDLVRSSCIVWVRGSKKMRRAFRSARGSNGAAVTTLMYPIQFVEQHGVVLEAGRGPRPNLAEAVAGERIHGNWWQHKKGRTIFRATRAVRDSDQILVCRLVGGKFTYVHRRLWPAIVRLATFLDKKAISALREEHSSSGAHRVITIPFPRWVPTDVRLAAKSLSQEEACLQLGDWIRPYLRNKV
jgi:hypothetical protein